MLNYNDLILRLRRKSVEKPWPGHPLPCWVWGGQTTDGGYGRVSFQGRTRAAHQVAYEELRGPIETGLELDHLCRVRACWNPWHLDQVTPDVNFWRGLGPLHQAAKTRCKFGHPYDDTNTYRSGNHRMCKTCRATRSSAWDAANRERRAQAARERRARKRS